MRPKFNKALISEGYSASDSGSMIRAKVKDYVAFTKMRLASMVVMSAFLSYLLAAESIDWLKVFYLVIGGFLVTGSSNGFNQIIERDIDRLMKRTESRPLPQGRMSVMEGLILATVLGVVGITILWFGLNPLSGVLGALALFIYVALYTPLKKVSPIAVFVGAFPGAIPPMLGYVAESGTFGIVPGLLFFVQFIWQFPHFWTIAWKVHDDYKRAGYRLLPSKGGRDKFSAFQILIYSLFLIPISVAPMWFRVGGPWALWIILLTGIGFFYYSVRLFLSCDEKDATKLMFASFIYLPIVQIAYLISA